MARSAANSRCDESSTWTTAAAMGPRTKRSARERKPPTRDSSTSAEASTTATDCTPSSSKDEKSQKSSGEGQKDIRFAPRKVQATLLSGGKKWSLVLLTEGGDEVGTLTVSHDGLQHVLATVPALKRGPAQEKKTQEFAIDGTSAIRRHGV